MQEIPICDFVISSGKTEFIYGVEVVLDKGFEVKKGAEFETIAKNISIDCPE